MHKSERLNHMMIYLMDRNFFNLVDLMNQFEISRSTALRDILSLEELGVPIYSEPGRFGGYHILENKQIPPISFTNDEVFALYFAMLTLGSYESTPFHLHFDSLKRKFSESISRTNTKRLAEMEKVLQFEVLKHTNTSPFLKDLLYAAVDRQVIKIKYQQRGQVEIKTIQPLKILARYGEWYCSAFDFEKETLRTYRCDRVITFEKTDSLPSLDFDNIQDPYTTLRGKDTRFLSFEVAISEDGIHMFRMENYPNMSLHTEGGEIFIRGYYAEQEEDFMAGYLLRYGETIKQITPARLKNALIEKATGLKMYFNRIPGK